MTVPLTVFAGEHQSGWTYVLVLGGIGGVILLLAGINSILVHFFPSMKKSYTAGGNALMRVEALFLPGREHVIEAREREDAEQDDAGEPPDHR